MHEEINIAKEFVKRLPVYSIY